MLTSGRSPATLGQSLNGWELGAQVDRGAPEVASRSVSFETTEGTFMNVDTSPDGEGLVFDLLGDIYWLPMSGGFATPLTSGRAWDQAPRCSGDGRYVYFVSDRDGTANIWRLSLSDRALEQVTRSSSNFIGALNWSQDGRALTASLQVPGESGWNTVLLTIDPNGTPATTLYSREAEFLRDDGVSNTAQNLRVYSAVQAANGNVYFDESHFDRSRERRRVRIYELDPQSEKRTAMTAANATYSEYKPQLSHSGSLLTYFRQHVDGRTEIRILDQQTRRDRRLLWLEGADDAASGATHDSRPSYAFTPDDKHLVLWHKGKILRVNLQRKTSTVIPFTVKVVREVWERALPPRQRIEESDSANAIRWPTFSHDGQKIAFAAFGHIWITDAVTRRTARLTNSNDFEYMPAISPDGRSVVYARLPQPEDHDTAGALVVRDIDGGRHWSLTGKEGEAYLFPKWSDDGGKIAAMRESKMPDGGELTFGWIPAEGGEFVQVARAAPIGMGVLGVGTRVSARYISFDTAAQRLLFSHPVSKTRVGLFAARLDDRQQERLVIGSADVVGIAPAPDLRNLAITRRNGTTWLVPFEAGSDLLALDEMPEARLLGDGGAYYAAWTGSKEITYGFGSTISRLSLSSMQATSFDIDVKVPKVREGLAIALIGGRLLTMVDRQDEESVIESGTIVVEGQRITKIGPSTQVIVPAGAIVVDVSGRTLMPGLVETHYHRIGGSIGPSVGMAAVRLPQSGFNDRSAHGYGVTSAWDPGGVRDDGAPALVDLQRADRIIGPRWFHSAAGTVGYPYDQLLTYGDAASAVRRHKALGVTVLKEANTPSRIQRQWLYMAASEMNLGIVSHIDNFDGMMTRVLDGYTGGDHSYIPIPFYKDVSELLRRTGYIWTPNIMISSSNLGTAADAKNYYWWHVRDGRPGELTKLAAMTSVYRFDEAVVDPPEVPYEIHRVSRIARQAAKAAADGIHVGVSAHNMPAARLHGEMWHLWKGGLDAEDVLRAATAGNAEKLGLQEEIGTLESGKIADIVVLRENPLEDLKNTLAIEYTIHGGKFYDGSTGLEIEIGHTQEQASSRAPTLPHGGAH